MLLSSTAGGRAVSSCAVLLLTCLLFLVSYAFHRNTSTSIDTHQQDATRPVSQPQVLVQEPMRVPLHSPRPAAPRDRPRVERLHTTRPDLPQAPPHDGSEGTVKKKKKKKTKEPDHGAWHGVQAAARKASTEDNDEFLRLAMPKPQRQAERPVAGLKKGGKQRQAGFVMPKGGSVFAKEDKVHDADDAAAERHVWDL